MRNPHFNLESVNINGKPCYLITQEVLEDYVLLKESSRRKSNIRKVCSKAEALDILGCSETTLYRKLKDKDCKIRKGSVNGTFIVTTLYQELDK